MVMYRRDFRLSVTIIKKKLLRKSQKEKDIKEK